MLQLNYFVMIMALAAGLAWSVMFLISRRRETPGWKPFALAMAAVGAWSFGSALDLAAPTLPLKVAASKLQYLGVCAAAPAWLVFVARYTYSDRYLTRVLLVLISVVPAIGYCLALTNELHGWVWPGVALVSTPYGIMGVYEHGPVVWALLGYFSLLLLAGTWILVKTVLRVPSLYRWQAATMIGSAIIPWLSGLAFLFGYGPFDWLDLTPLSFVLAGLMLALNVFRWRLLERSPVAHNVVFWGMSEGAVVLDERGAVVEVNPAAQGMMGLTDAVVGRRARDVFSAWPALAGLCRADADGRCEIRPGATSGAQWVEVSSTAVSRRGVVVGRLLTFRDITTHKRDAQELEYTRARLMAAIEVSPSGILVVDAPDARIRSYNKATASILGMTPDENPVGLSLREYKPSWKAFRADGTEYAPEDYPFARAVARGEAVNDELARIRRSDGSERWVIVSGAPIRDAGGAILGAITVLSDITERRQAEESRREFERQLQQTQKLESLGVMAGGIAHDFNNILMAVIGNIDMAMGALPELGSARNDLAEAERAARRASDLIRQMLAYSGKGQFKVERVDLNGLLTEMTRMLELSSRHVALRFRLASTLPAVLVDATQMRQVVMNLVINAAEAMQRRDGLISIATGASVYDQEFMRTMWISENLPAGEYVWLEVSDTGVGMTRDVMARIFDPFFTTKHSGRGLGLAAVLGIVRGHKGALHVYSEVGRGTTFRIYLPSVGQEAKESIVAVQAPVPWRGHGLILLADDEPSLRVVGRRMLESLGFEVIVAENGRVALDLFRQHQNAVKGVLLDLIMPHMGGDEVLAEIRRVKPDVPAIMMSGYSDSYDVVQASLALHSLFIQKPFNRTELMAKLEQLFAAKALGLRQDGHARLASPSLS